MITESRKRELLSAHYERADKRSKTFMKLCESIVRPEVIRGREVCGRVWIEFEEGPHNSDDVVCLERLTFNARCPMSALHPAYRIMIREFVDGQEALRARRDADEKLRQQNEKMRRQNEKMRELLRKLNN